MRLINARAALTVEFATMWVQSPHGRSCGRTHSRVKTERRKNELDSESSAECALTQAVWRERVRTRSGGKIEVADFPDRTANVFLEKPIKLVGKHFVIKR